MPTTYLDPVPKSATPAEPYTLRADTSKPVRIGLVANSFPGSARFLTLVGEAVGRLIESSSVAYAKDELGINASITLRDDQVSGIRDEIDAVITAYGH